MLDVGRCDLLRGSANTDVAAMLFVIRGSPQPSLDVKHKMLVKDDEESGRPPSRGGLSSSLSAKLAALDVNNDGHIDDNELLQAVEDLVLEERRGRVLWHQAAALLAALLLVVGATVGCVYGIVSLTKPYKAS
jgi:hypothetical protein